MIAHTLPELQTILDTFRDLGQEIVLQEFVAECKGTDVRALVVGGRVVGAMRRQAKRGEFRSNLHRGGEGAHRAAPRLCRGGRSGDARHGAGDGGRGYAGGARGATLMEVNSSPGFEGLERATGQDAAGAIIDRALALARARDVATRRAL